MSDEAKATPQGEGDAGPASLIDVTVFDRLKEMKATCSDVEGQFLIGRVVSNLDVLQFHLVSIFRHQSLRDAQSTLEAALVPLRQIERDAKLFVMRPTRRETDLLIALFMTASGSVQETADSSRGEALSDDFPALLASLVVKGHVDQGNRSGTLILTETGQDVVRRHGGWIRRRVILAGTWIGERLLDQMAGFVLGAAVAMAFAWLLAQLAILSPELPTGSPS